MEDSDGSRNSKKRIAALLILVACIVWILNPARAYSSPQSSTLVADTYTPADVSAVEAARGGASTESPAARTSPEAASPPSSNFVGCNPSWRETSELRNLWLSAAEARMQRRGSANLDELLRRAASVCVPAAIADPKLAEWAALQLPTPTEANGTWQGIKWNPAANDNDSFTLGQQHHAALKTFVNSTLMRRNGNQLKLLFLGDSLMRYLFAGATNALIEAFGRDFLKLSSDDDGLSVPVDPEHRTQDMTLPTRSHDRKVAPILVRYVHEVYFTKLYDTELFSRANSDIPSRLRNKGLNPDAAALMLQHWRQHIDDDNAEAKSGEGAEFADPDVVFVNRGAWDFLVLTPRSPQRLFVEFTEGLVMLRTRLPRARIVVYGLHHIQKDKKCTHKGQFTYRAAVFNAVRRANAMLLALSSTEEQLRSAGFSTRRGRNGGGVPGLSFKSIEYFDAYGITAAVRDVETLTNRGDGLHYKGPVLSKTIDYLWGHLVRGAADSAHSASPSSLLRSREWSLRAPVPLFESCEVTGREWCNVLQVEGDGRSRRPFVMTAPLYHFGGSSCVASEQAVTVEKVQAVDEIMSRAAALFSTLGAGHAGLHDFFAIPAPAATSSHSDFLALTQAQRGAQLAEHVARAYFVIDKIETAFIDKLTPVRWGALHTLLTNVTLSCHDIMELGTMLSAKQRVQFSQRVAALVERDECGGRRGAFEKAFRILSRKVWSKLSKHLRIEAPGASVYTGALLLASNRPRVRHLLNIDVEDVAKTLLGVLDDITQNRSPPRYTLLPTAPRSACKELLKQVSYLPKGSPRHLASRFFVGGPTIGDLAAECNKVFPDLTKS